MKKLSDYLYNQIDRLVNEIDYEIDHKSHVNYHKLHMLKELLEIDEYVNEYNEDEYKYKSMHHHEHIPKSTYHDEYKTKSTHPKEHMYHEWLSNLKNEDGTHGEHWSIKQTTDVAKDHNVYFENISEKDWHMVLNMMYSDYCDVAKKHNVNTIGFYVDMAKAWLWDKDTIQGKEKIKEYYENIVEPHKK